MGVCQAPSHTNTKILTLALMSPEEQKGCEQDSFPQHPHRTEQTMGALSSPGAQMSIGSAVNSQQDTAELPPCLSSHNFLN